MSPPIKGTAWLAPLALAAATVYAGDLKVLAVTAPGLMRAMEQLRPEFERKSGYQIKISFALASEIHRLLEAGERTDVIILPRSGIDQLNRENRIDPNVRSDFARTGIGICVRAGNPKPDVSSVEAFKRALLAARSITFNEAVSSGAYVANLLRRIGLDQELRPKIVPAENKPGPGKVVGVVARGEADLGLVITTDILSDTGVDFVGPLPPELQSYIVFTACASKGAEETSGAKALIDFLRSPTVLRLIKANGMKPVE